MKSLLPVRISLRQAQAERMEKRRDNQVEE